MRSYIQFLYLLSLTSIRAAVLPVQISDDLDSVASHRAYPQASTNLSLPVLNATLAGGPLIGINVYIGRMIKEFTQDKQHSFHTVELYKVKIGSAWPPTTNPDQLSRVELSFRLVARDGNEVTHIKTFTSMRYRPKDEKGIPRGIATYEQWGRWSTTGCRNDEYDENEFEASNPIQWGSMQAISVRHALDLVQQSGDPKIGPSLRHGPWSIIAITNYKEVVPGLTEADTLTYRVQALPKAVGYYDTPTFDALIGVRSDKAVVAPKKLAFYQDRSAFFERFW